MGRIESLSLENFKSYAGRQVIGPFKSFTAVIGPNGAGKSNLMDAICFVVGLSARSLRGDKLLDLVFGNANEKRAKTASVTLHYITSADEVEGCDEGDEMLFTRSITSAGASVYKVNNKEVSFETYTEALASINLITKARNFLVFQGDVESVACKDDKELMRHFEIFSGSDALREPFEEAMKDLHEVRTELSNKSAKRRLTMQERKAIKAEKDEADRYLELVKRRDEIRVQLALFKLYCLEQRIQAEEETKLEAELELNELKEKDEAIAARMQDAAKTLSKLQKELSQKEKAMAAADRQAIKTSSNADELTARIASSSTRCEELAAKLKAARREAEHRDAEIEDLTNEVANMESKLAHMETRSAASRGGVSLDAHQRAEFSRLRGVALQKSAEINAKLEALRRDQAADEASVSASRGGIESLLARKSELQTTLEQQTTRKTTLEQAQQHAITARKEKEKELHEMRLQHLDVQKRYEEISSELLEVKTVLHAHRESRARSENEKRMEQAVEDLKRLFPGVRGRLVDLVIPTQKNVKTAVSIALGKHIDSIVVNSEAIAFECVNWLRERKVRPMTFLPLDSLRTKELDDSLVTLISSYKSKSGTPVFRLAKDCIRYDSELEIAVSFACGTAVIADTLADAKELRYRRQVPVKVITLDGTIIAKNGNMTGGSGGGDDTYSKASKWDDKELRAAQAKRDELLAEEELLKRKISKTRTAASESLHVLIEDMESSLNTHNTRLSAISREIDAITENIKKTKSELASITAALAKQLPGYDAAKLRMVDRGAEISALEAKIGDVHDEVFAEFAESLGLENVRDFETQVVARQEAEMRARQEVSDALSRLRAKLDYEKERQAANGAAAAEKELNSERNELSQLKQKEKDVRAAAEESKKTAETLRNELKKLNQDLREAEGIKDSSQRDKRGIAEARSAASKRMASVQSAVERLFSQRHEVLMKAQMDEVVLPVKKSTSGRRQSRNNVEAQDTPVFSQHMSISSNNEDVDAYAENDQRRSDRIDFDKLDDDLQEQAGKHEDETVGKLERRLHDSETQLSKHSPNLKAATQLADIDARFKQETEEFDECRARCAEAETKFLNVKTERTRLFMTAYQHAAKVIDHIYKELTKSAEHPMGGKASLQLTREEDIFENDDCGIKFDVMPPGKRFRERDMLSGGEKTFAALALIFSLHSFRPSPFFVMDEIDAALDNPNVLRIANYIRKRASDEGGQTPSMQAIVISLKDAFYEKASALVGVYRDASLNCSRSLTLDLARLSLEAAATK